MEGEGFEEFWYVRARTTEERGVGKDALVDRTQYIFSMWDY